MKHLAVVRQPFYDFILDGTKTIESRWCLNKCAPYKKIAVGDTIFFKQPGKDADATAQVKDVKFFELTPKLANEIKSLYGKEIRIDKFENWEIYANKKYLTLIWLEKVKRITPCAFNKKGRAGWVLIKEQK